MRYLISAVPCLLCTAALVVSGCAEQNERVATLEDENMQLVADRENLGVELAAARDELANVTNRAQASETECLSLRERLEDHITQLTNAKIREQTLQDSAKQLQHELKETRADYAVGVGRAQETSKKAEQAEQEAKKRVAELARELERTQANLEQTKAELRKAREQAENPPEETR